MADKITEYVVKHYYGEKAKYDEESHGYGVYFATDEKEIIFNGDSYGAVKVAGDELVLSKNENGLKTTISISYDSDNKLISLTGINDAVLASIDASDFIKDGMLLSAELVQENDKGETGEFIKLVWNTDEGGDTMYIDVSELIDIYVEGNGIEIDDHTISVKVDSNSESFLTVGGSGLSLSGVQDAINAAVAEVEAEALDTAVAVDEDATHLTISSEKDGNTTTYTIGESDIASASDLSDLTTFVGSFDDAESESVCGAINTNSEAISELEEKVSALEATSIDVVGDNDHISVTSATEDLKTTYTITGSDIASAEFVGSLNDASDAGTVCAAIAKNEEAIEELEAAVEELEAATVSVVAEEEEKHIVVEPSTDDDGAITYTLTSSDVASAAFVGEFSDYEGTVCEAVEGIANSLMWIEVS